MTDTAPETFEDLLDEADAANTSYSQHSDLSNNLIQKLAEALRRAIAHDRQTYPTVWSYEQLANTLRERDLRIETALAALPVLTSNPHGAIHAARTILKRRIIDPGPPITTPGVLLLEAFKGELEWINGHENRVDITESEWVEIAAKHLAMVFETTLLEPGTLTPALMSHMEPDDGRNTA